VALSTDSADGLHKTFAQAKEGQGFPFPILSDSTLATFKAYRAFDDFEGIPLHGTFLIDGAGLVRWQDIGYQPFRDPAWLLGEAKRLLGVPLPEVRTAGASVANGK
jgi:alkyl hydroperoxide reductase subunit AhpC